MYFVEKRNCIRIRKREDHVPDLVCTPGRVGTGYDLLTFSGIRAKV